MNFLYPVPSSSIVTQSFAEHVHAARVNNWQNYNGGIDWAVPTGSPVVAAQSGKVTQVRNDATGYGHHVRIQHEGGYLTIYAHLMDSAVRVGDKVHAGEVIGRSDNTGNSTGPHLHFELRRNNIAVDPAPLLVHVITPDGQERPEPIDPGGGITGGGFPTGEPPITGEPPVTGEPLGEEPEQFPELPRARVLSTIGLNIRMGPGVVNPIVGWLPPGKSVEVLRKLSIDGDTWLQIGYEQFIGFSVAGDVLAGWEQPKIPPQAARRRRKSRKP